MPTVRQMLYNLALAGAKEFFFNGWGRQHRPPCYYSEVEGELKKQEYENIFPLLEEEIRKGMDYFEQALKINGTRETLVPELDGQDGYERFIQELSFEHVHDLNSAMSVWLNKNQLTWLKFPTIPTTIRAFIVSFAMLSMSYEGLESKEAKLTSIPDSCQMDGEIYTADPNQIVRYHIDFHNRTEFISYIPHI